VPSNVSQAFHLSDSNIAVDLTTHQTVSSRQLYYPNRLSSVFAYHNGPVIFNVSYPIWVLTVTRLTLTSTTTALPIAIAMIVIVSGKWLLRGLFNTHPCGSCDNLRTYRYTACGVRQAIKRFVNVSVVDGEPVKHNGINQDERITQPCWVKVTIPVRKDVAPHLYGQATQVRKRNKAL
jgi:hypothetical protein